ncbi:DUF6103 family protein [Anaerotruncus rubiinfantis]|uniref:DUF6103 family protein n=1 Tax=Anaerotruncus rubiinfantis TaxID=1720200 RepID=UPI000834BE5E|nr:DUF6103 family protein [Anaerotruncus rubiinfantis]
MKKTTFQIQFDTEKLSAIQRYMLKKDADLMAELEETLDRLYEKYVPAAVREYIEGRAEEDDQRPARSDRVRRKQTAMSENEGGIE